MSRPHIVTRYGCLNPIVLVTHVAIGLCVETYRVSQNYPNMYFSTIISIALKPLKMWIPKFSEILIKRQS